MTTQPFRERAKSFVMSIVNQRLYLIRNSNKYQLWHTEELRMICENTRNNLQLLQSDHSVAGYLVRNCDKIYALIPKNVRFKFGERISAFRQLISEAKEINESHKNPQNLVR